MNSRILPAATCRACGSAIVWAWTDGKLIPVDLDAHPDGAIVLDVLRSGTLVYVRGRINPAHDGPRHRAHVDPWVQATSRREGRGNLMSDRGNQAEPRTDEPPHA